MGAKNPKIQEGCHGMTKQGPFQAGGCSKFFMVIYQVNRREKNMMISINAWEKKKKKPLTKFNAHFKISEKVGIE